eukprot:13473179-Alexandrium_andersonii.AAC.1
MPSSSAPCDAAQCLDIGGDQIGMSRIALPSGCGGGAAAEGSTECRQHGNLLPGLGKSVAC